jgi:uncharacterized protein YciI
MTLFAVTRGRGPAWDHSRRMREQDAWDEHAAFMEGLVDQGLIRLGGPLGDDHVLLIAEAESPEEVEARLAEDPWVPLELLRVLSIERWTILLGTRPD